MQKKKSSYSPLPDSRGFSLLEVLFGITVFMIGMIGVTALNISSLKSNTFSGNMSEATYLAAGKIEELMALEYNDPGGNLNDTDADGTNQDDDDGNGNGDGVDSVGNFGLDDIGTGAGEADHFDLNVGKNDMFSVYWNIAVDEPMPDTKTINVIVEWDIKGVKRRMNIQTVKMKTN